MRKLNKKQKTLLENLAKQGFCLLSDIPRDTWNKIESINDYETLHQDAERYLGDKHSEIKYSNKLR